MLCRIMLQVVDEIAGDDRAEAVGDDTERGIRSGGFGEALERFGEDAVNAVVGAAVESVIW